ncbi:MAG: hypothetical protein HQL29_01935 [Candidatus Omnitrophica bacterium]|nr:hypothetical protein [Candidatus Omnitrophota bacterium]
MKIEIRTLQIFVLFIIIHFVIFTPTTYAELESWIKNLSSQEETKPIEPKGLWEEEYYSRHLKFSIEYPYYLKMGMNTGFSPKTSSEIIQLIETRPYHIQISVIKYDEIAEIFPDIFIEKINNYLVNNILFVAKKPDKNEYCAFYRGYSINIKYGDMFDENFWVN